MASQNQQQEQRETAKLAAEETGTDPAVIAAAASVLLSWYYFFGEGNREMGVFVATWPPTIFAFVSYFKQTRMSDMIEESMGSS